MYVYVSISLSLYIYIYTYIYIYILMEAPDAPSSKLLGGPPPAPRQRPEHKHEA